MRIDLDITRFETLRPLLAEPTFVDALSDADIEQIRADCIRQLSRLRMGGRSSALIGLAVLLWTTRERNQVLQVEELLALSFRVAVDPSYVQPEWAVTLAGVLIAAYTDQVPSEARTDVFDQCRRLLDDLERGTTFPSPLRAAAGELLSDWRAGFPTGMRQVADVCLRSWPDTEPVRWTPQEALDQAVADMWTRLPNRLTDRERRLYRLHVERRGIWQMLEGIPARLESTGDLASV